MIIFSPIWFFDVATGESLVNSLISVHCTVASGESLAFATDCVQMHKWLNIVYVYVIVCIRKWTRVFKYPTGV